MTIASYNVLATAYIRPGLYDGTDPLLLAEAHRVPALVRRIQGLEADVCCLQEIEPDCFEAIEAALGPIGYSGRMTMKSGHRPDGCATFFRRDLWCLVEHERLAYDEGLDPRPSGHIAQLLLLQHDAHVIAVANTHLRWDPPDTPSGARYGEREIHALLARLSQAPYAGRPRVVCGDFNAEPGGTVVAAMREHGLVPSHVFEQAAPTCVANGRAMTVDYIFCTPELAPEPQPVPVLDDATTLPNDDEPSDHVPIVARIALPASARSGAH